MASYPVGKAPWETSDTPTPGAPQSFAVGKAPWEVTPPSADKAPRYDVQETPQHKQAKFASEASVAKAEADQANSIPGFIKNTVTAPAMESLPFVGGAISVGKTLNKLIDNPTDRNFKSIKDLGDYQVKISKQIQQLEKTGKDTTQLKQVYNDNADMIDSLKSENDQHMKDLPTAWQAAGHLGHLAMDVVTAGTYGLAKKGAESFKLFNPRAIETVGSTIANHMGSAGTILKETPNVPLAEVLGRAKINIVDQLKYKGLGNLATKVGELNPAQFSSIDEFTNAVKAATNFKGEVPAISAFPTVVQDVGKLLKKPESVKELALNLLRSSFEGGVAGYGYDVATNLEDGKTGGEAFKPGAMTAIGGTIPLGAALARGGTTQMVRLYRAIEPNEKAINEEVSGLQNAWQKFFDGKKSTIKIDARAQSQGKDNAAILAKHGYMPDIKDNAIDTTRIAAQNQADIKATGEGIQAHLDELDRVAPTTSLTPFKEFKDAIIRDVRNDPQFKRTGTTKQVEAQALKRLQSFEEQYPNGIPLGEMNRIRLAMNNPKTGTAAFNAPEFDQDIENILGNVTRKFIDNKSGSDVVRRTNQSLAELMSIKKLIDPTSKSTINGDKVNFGRMSQYFARVIGSIAGSSTGVPILGPILGSIGGDMFIKMLNQQTFGGPVRRAILSELKNNPKLIEQFQKEMSDVEFKALQREMQKIPQLPAPQGKYPMSSVEVPINLPAKTTSTRDAEEIARIQAQRRSMSQDTNPTASTISNNLNAKEDISGVVPSTDKLSSVVSSLLKKAGINQNVKQEPYYRSYSPNDKLPEIQMGPKAKSKPSNEPSIDIENLVPESKPLVEAIKKLLKTKAKKK